MTIFNRTFLADAAERAVKTVAQSLVSLFLVGNTVFNVLSVNWKQAISVAVSAGVISILMSLGSSQTGDSYSASLVVETKNLK